MRKLRFRVSKKPTQGHTAMSEMGEEGLQGGLARREAVARAPVVKGWDYGVWLRWKAIHRQLGGGEEPTQHQNLPENRLGLTASGTESSLPLERS